MVTRFVTNGKILDSILIAKDIYLDCTGQIGGTKILDDCGICGGSGPQFTCESSGKSYCTEYQYQQECKSD